MKNRVFLLVLALALTVLLAACNRATPNTTSRAHAPTGRGCDRPGRPCGGRRACG